MGILMTRCSQSWQTSLRIFTVLAVAVFVAVNLALFLLQARLFNNSIKSQTRLFSVSPNVSSFSDEMLQNETKVSGRPIISFKPGPVEKWWEFNANESCKDFAANPNVATKVVLLWTLFFSTDWSGVFNDYLHSRRFVEIDGYDCQVRCNFTLDRRLLDQASAVLFHPRDMHFGGMPQVRYPFQRWIFYLHESPLHSGFKTDFDYRVLNTHAWNWTMTYSKKANVYFPYGHLRPSTEKVDAAAMKTKISKMADSFKKRPVDAVWIVSNCFAPSERHFYVHALKGMGISVDIFGDCGSAKPDDEWKETGEQQFFSKYRFVLAFENSLCDDYVTEKAFHAFYANYIAGSIPVVYGTGNYSEFFPDGSYINVSSFGNLTDLVAYIKNLSKADASSPELLSYYDWQIEVNPEYSHGYELKYQKDLYQLYYSTRPAWRALCKKLWDEDTGTLDNVNEENMRKYSNTVADVRSQLGQCYEADLSAVPQLFRPAVLNRTVAHKANLTRADI